MAYILGVDLGTSSIRSLIFNTDDKTEFVGQVEYQFNIPRLGWAEQNPEVWWNSFLKSFKQAIKKADISANLIEAVSFSGQMHGLVLLDSRYEVIRPAILWCDQRTAEIVEKLNNNSENVDFFRKKALNKVHAGFALASLLWVKEHEKENFSNICVILSPKDWLRYRICGLISTEKTDAAGSLMFDIENEKWSSEIQNRFGLSPRIFPPVYQPIDQAGYVTKNMVRELGFSTQCKVFHGGADQVMQAIGNSLIKPGTVSVTIGTGGQVLTILPKAQAHPSLASHTFNYVLPHSYYFMGATLSAGLSLRWLKNIILKMTDYKEMDYEAEKVSVGSEGLLFLPYLMGERTPHSDPYARGMFFGLNIKHGRGHMIRSLLEGVVFSLKDSFLMLDDLNVNYDKVIASGGGAHSKIWLQIQADILGLPVFVSESKEQAALGAAITAAVGNNIYTSFEEACGDCVTWQSVPVQPNKNNVMKYQKRYEVFRKIYEINKDIMKGEGISE